MQQAATSEGWEERVRKMFPDGEGKKNVLFGLTGSVASIKAIELAVGFSEFANVIVLPSKTAQHFVSIEELKTIPGVSVFTDEDEYSMWSGRGDPVLHIELRRWADVFIVAPLSANSMAKLAYGLSDTLLTCVARAWDLKKPFLVAPAMNVLMWQHPHTEKHLKALTELDIKIIDSIETRQMCGDWGKGAMAKVDTIIFKVREALHLPIADILV